MKFQVIATAFVYPGDTADEAAATMAAFDPDPSIDNGDLTIDGAQPTVNPGGLVLPVGTLIDTTGIQQTSADGWTFVPFAWQGGTYWISPGSISAVSASSGGAGAPAGGSKGSSGSSWLLLGLAALALAYVLKKRKGSK